MRRWKGARKTGRLDPDKIRELMAGGMNTRQVAEKFGVTTRAVYACLQRDEKKKHGFGKGSSMYGIDKVKELGSGDNRVVDPETGLVVDLHGPTAMVVGRMGDEKVSAFVDYHMDCLAMRQGVDKRNVQDLYDRFIRYLQYCREHGVIPGSANARLAVGLSATDIHDWLRGIRGTPEHKQFAEDYTAVLSSMNEQAAADGILNPVLSIFWSKAYFGLSDQPKVEVEVVNPLGERQSAEEISKRYSDLPDD